MLDCKRARQSRQRVVRIQSALCEVACELNRRGLKMTVVKFNRTVISVYASKHVRRIANSFVIRIKNKQVIVV